jgi:hypothetical protein
MELLKAPCLPQEPVTVAHGVLAVVIPTPEDAPPAPIALFSGDVPKLGDAAGQPTRFDPAEACHLRFCVALEQQPSDLLVGRRQEPQEVGHLDLGLPSVLQELSPYISPPIYKGQVTLKLCMECDIYSG